MIKLIILITDNLFVLLIHQRSVQTNKLHSATECNVKNCAQQNSWWGWVILAAIRLVHFRVTENLQFNGVYLTLQSVSLGRNYRLDTIRYLNLKWSLRLANQLV